LSVSVTISYPVHAPELPPITPARGKTFLFVGRLVPEKGGHIFAEAARRAKVPALFIGDGEERSALERTSPEAEFAGWLDQATVTERLRHCRALVFPSLWYETLGLVVVEAMAQGVPVIVSDATAAAGLIKDEDTGLLFASGSVEDLQRQIERLQDDRLVEKLGQRAYQWYWSAPWTAEKHVKELKSLYAKILRDDQVN
jgi:glycosyltransferase involved in cell wall biosynthesis